MPFVEHHTVVHGQLGVMDLEGLPFRPRRLYWLWGTPGAAVRGRHAHRTLRQFLVVLSGSVCLVLDSGTDRKTYKLRAGEQGIEILPGMWRELHSFSPDAVVLVLADQAFDPDDYIHDHEEFIQWKREA